VLNKSPEFRERRANAFGLNALGWWKLSENACLALFRDSGESRDPGKMHSPGFRLSREYPLGVVFGQAPSGGENRFWTQPREVSPP
jgi:hypothetical protein